MAPSCVMPCVSAEFPATLLSTDRAANSCVLRRSACPSGSVTGVCGNRSLLPLLRNKLPAPFPQSHVFLRFLRQAFTLMRIEDDLADHPPNHLRTEIILAVEPLHPIHQLGFVQVL